MPEITTTFLYKTMKNSDNNTNAFVEYAEITHIMVHAFVEEDVCMRRGLREGSPHSLTAVRALD